MISRNMSGSDRVSRILLAMCLIAFSISGQIGNRGWIVSLVLLVTHGQPGARRHARFAGLQGEEVRPDLKHDGHRCPPYCNEVRLTSA